MFNFTPDVDNIAAVTEDCQFVSYRELNICCQELANHIEKRSLIFSLCSNCIGSLCGYVCSLQYNHVPLMLDEHIDQMLLDRFIAIYKPDYLYLPADKAASFPFQAKYAALGYVLLKTPYRHEFPLHNELALLLTTSGSMGSPKFVRQSYHNLVSNTRAIIDYLEINEQERAITSLPMNYTYGLSIINTHLERNHFFITQKFCCFFRGFTFKYFFIISFKLVSIRNSFLQIFYFINNQTLSKHII